MSLKSYKITDTHVTIRTELGKVTLTREELQDIAIDTEWQAVRPHSLEDGAEHVVEKSIDLDPWTDAEGKA